VADHDPVAAPAAPEVDAQHSAVEAVTGTAEPVVERTRDAVRHDAPPLTDG
jgi:hypothetical protein